MIRTGRRFCTPVPECCRILFQPLPFHVPKDLGRGHRGLHALQGGRDRTKVVGVHEINDGLFPCHDLLDFVG